MLFFVLLLITFQNCRDVSSLSLSNTLNRNNVWMLYKDIILLSSEQHSPVPVSSQKNPQLGQIENLPPVRKKAINIFQPALDYAAAFYGHAW